MPRIAWSWMAFVLIASAANAQSPPENVILRGHLDRGENYSGNWGYTSPTGVELAISGTASGTTFINATDPSNPVEVAFIPAPNSTWREMATYGQYCYIVTEASGAALQIVSLANPLAPVLVTTLNPPTFPYSTAHEIKIDQQTGYCYVAGTGPGAGQPNRGLVILDLASPTNPTLRGTWTTVYVHDLSLLNGRAYCATLDNGVYVLDVTQPGTPPVLAHWTYPGEFTHNTWPSADGHYLVTSDETGGGHLRMWDISNLSQVVQTGEWAPSTNSIVHNVYLRGNICYMSHYRDGLRVVDVSDPFNLEAVGWYDTHASAGNGFDGAWGCYCFATDPSIVYISDIQTGTYILQFNDQFGRLNGTVRNANNQTPVEGAAVEVVGAANRTTNAQGFYSAILNPGTYTVNCTAFGYEPASASGVTIAPAQTTVLDFDLVPSPSGSLTGVVRRSTDATPIPGVGMVLESTPLSTTTGAGGDYNFASVPAGGYNLTASKLGFAPQTVPVTIVATQQTTQDLSLLPAYYWTDMETSPGWTVSGNATTGQWVLVDPNGTVGGTVQPEDDHTPAPGVLCWVTGQGAPNGGVGDNDVDNGSTTLTTQVFDLTSVADPKLSYWRWYSNDYNGSADDPWIVEISSNGGTSWTAIENTLTAEAFWKQITKRIADYVTPSAQFRVRFTARDLAPASIVEAAVDDFQIYAGQAPVGVEEPSQVAIVRPALLGNSPNPFHPATAIRFELPQAAQVRLRVYDVAGRMVRELLDGRLPAGRQSVIWDGRDQTARPLAGGVYFYRVEAGSFSEARSMVLAK